MYATTAVGEAEYLIDSSIVVRQHLSILININSEIDLLASFYYCLLVLQLLCWILKNEFVYFND